MRHGAVLAVHRGHRWSTRTEVVVTDPAAAVDAARLLDEVLDRVEIIASRFRADSEINALHRTTHGRRVPIPVSPGLRDALAVALWAARATDGAVDPTVGTALCRLGYDRDFAEVTDGVPGDLPPPTPVPGWRSVVLDAERCTVTMSPGTELDLGATAKALAADHAASVIAGRLGCGVLVSLGGDVSVENAPAGGFVVGVSDICGDPDAPTSVVLSAGGLATSGVGSRHWSLGGVDVHHVVDPSTGRPTPPCWRTVTVAGASCVDANAASTASLVLGPAAPAWLAANALPSRLVHVDGSVETVAGWPADAPAPGAVR